MTKPLPLSRKILLALVLLLGLVLMGCGVTLLVRQHRAEKKQSALEAAAVSYTLPAPGEAQTEAGRLLIQAWRAAASAVPLGAPESDGDEAAQRYALTFLDPDSLLPPLNAALRSRQEAWVAAASRRAEVYEADGSVRPDLLDEAFPEALAGALTVLPLRTQEAALRLKYTDGVWTLENAPELDALLLGALADPDEAARELLRRAAGELTYLPLHYTIAPEALAAPAPDPACFGETEDPAVIEALLQTPEAQRLIGGQTLVWNAGIERYPKGTAIRWYLDETILVLVWQEVEHGGVGTFSEVFLADGSQIRRKISGDQLYDLHFDTASSFGQAAGAVLTSGGDMYYHGRMCGVGFYQGQLYRFEPDTCDSCCVTAEGDLLFLYRGTVDSEEAARRFAEENDVVFSLVFGPVLIDGGQNVTPDYYAWGQINDEYARSALGQLGKLHYLKMDLNCGTGRYYHLFTLKQAAASMLARGCEKAYALDGGQTAVTVLGDRLINPVQFGFERRVSDILYFATAIPEE